MPETGIFQIFQAGTHIDGNGVKRTFTEQDVADMAASYDPAQHDAPLLIRHDPSYAHGYLSKAIQFGSKLYASARNVAQAFRDKIKDGWKISVGLYSPEDERNPTPGKWAIREVSTVPIPGVKGMADPSPAFGEGDGLIYITFAECPTEVEFSEVSVTTENTSREAEIAAREAALVAREVELDKQLGASFAESLVVQGKILPRQKDAIAALYCALPSKRDIQFGEAGQTVSGRDLLSRVYEQAEKVIVYGEVAKGSEAVPAPNLVEFAENYRQEQAAKGKVVSASAAIAYAKEKLGVS